MTREEAAKRNAERAPFTAAMMECSRRCFGDGVKLIWVIENGRTAGKVPYEYAKEGV